MVEKTETEIDRLTVAQAKARFAAAMKRWPHDTSKPMTDQQLQEQGAVDVTDDHEGLGIYVGLGQGK
jgi:hypothetical protein